jgi:hypothetical protein
MGVSEFSLLDRQKKSLTRGRVGKYNLHQVNERAQFGRAHQFAVRLLSLVEERYNLVHRFVRLIGTALLLGACCLALPIAPAHAIPALQLYSPDAVWDSSLETWLITDDTFELWVIGDVGSKGTIYDVDLAVSFYGTSGSITLTPIVPTPIPTIDLDPTDQGGYFQIINHEEYRNATSHQFWSLGDMTSTSDIIQDYQPGSDPGTGTGTIFKYMVHVSGYEAVHFDAFDHYFTGGDGNGANAGYKTHYVFAPFSHDATQEPPPDVPEPSGAWMIAAGLAGLLLARRRKP